MTSGTKEADIAKDAKNLEKMMVDCETGKYDIVLMASLWSKHLKQKEEYRDMPTAEIIDTALRQVLAGKVSWDDIKASAKEERDRKLAEKDKKGKKRADSR